MQAEIKKAVCFGDRTAEDKLQNISYRRIETMSNLKESIGELLLYLQTPLKQEKQLKGWGLFEILLTQYIETKYLERKL